MFRYLAIMFICIICGCSAYNVDVTDEFKLPPELQDYKVLQLTKHNSSDTIYVLVKKHNENRAAIGTTSKQGKKIIHSIVIDDVEYQIMNNTTETIRNNTN